MPTIQENKSTWDQTYTWTHDGAEWSRRWGGPAMEWYGTLLPRIHAFLPTDTILEIACGHGRWTHFIKDQCRHLIAIDLAENCIEACQRRFAADSHISYFVNDGKALDMLKEGSIDFVFSFDSLVHADETVLQAYISQLLRILKPDGAAFLHHSNLGAYFTKFSKIPPFKEYLTRSGIHQRKLHWRDLGVSAKLVAQFAEQAGLQCISQETVAWRGGWVLTDCFSTIVKKDSSRECDNRTLRNFNFGREVIALSKLARVYGSLKKGTL